MFWVCVPGVLFCFISFEKTGVCSGFVPGVLFLLHFFFEKIWGVFRVCCDCFIFFEKLWGVFWVCSVCSSVLFLLTRFSAHESRKALTQLFCVRWRILNYREFVELLQYRYLPEGAIGEVRGFEAALFCGHQFEANYFFFTNYLCFLVHFLISIV